MIAASSGGVTIGALDPSPLAAVAAPAVADAAERAERPGVRAEDDADGDNADVVALGHGERSLRLVYADPPYPGNAELYAGHPDYAGEVDHEQLLAELVGYDGWALSTSAAALRSVLPLCPPGVRVLAWIKHTIGVSWEPLIVSSARPVVGVRDWIRVEPESFQWRERPPGHVIGAKPLPFALWLFEWLGARPGDELVDLFPGSGAIARAWEAFALQPQLPRPTQLELVEDAARPTVVAIAPNGRMRRRRSQATASPSS